MDEIEELIEGLHLDNQLSIEDIPDLELYMDQVIQLFERTFSSSKRNEKEKVLTKTMINNYAKGKLFFPIENKKYSKEHILLISMIYQMKGSLSISDIKTTLTQLNEEITENNFELEKLYEHYLQLAQNNVDRFTEDVKGQVADVKIEVNQMEEATTYFEQLLLAASLAQMSNFYRKAAEKIVDDISEQNNQEDPS